MAESPNEGPAAGPEALPPQPEAAGKRTTSVQSLNWIVLVVIVLALFLLFRIRTQTKLSDPRQAPGVGHKLSMLELRPLTGGGEPVGVGGMAGKVTLVNFWATWCPPCKRELPEIAELEKRLHGQADVRLLAVACDPQDPARATEETSQLLRSMNLDMPTYADVGEATQRALQNMDGFSPFCYPTTIVLDRQGVIRAAWHGYSPGAVEQMEEVIEELQKGS